MGIYERTMRMLATFNSESFQSRGLEHPGVGHLCDTQAGRTRPQVEGLAGKQVPRLVHRQIKPAATVLCRGPGGATEAHDGVELVARLARLRHP